MKKIYLASQSPRRLELLSQLGLQAEPVIAPIEEVALPHESPHAFVVRMAVEKAYAGFNKVSGTDSFVIGGDTVVLADGKVLGKPKNRAAAFAMWQRLAGKSHQVLSAVAVVKDGVVRSALNTTQVWFRPMSEPEMTAYWQSGEPQDKAGAYAIQGLGAKFIEKIEGSYSGVMGLPLFELDQLLQQAGFYQDE
ncbi:Maf family protein [Galenea microaerophila]